MKKNANNDATKSPAVNLPTGTGRPEDCSVRPVDRSTWPDMEKLFEAKGAPSYCWCMAWRATKEEQAHTDSASRKSFLKARVDAGLPVGLLAYCAGEPVAWCSIAPKETYRKLEDLNLDDVGERIWSVVCFYIPKAQRGRKLARFLLQSAIGYATQNQATMVEAYPVDPESPSYRHMGFVSLFQGFGFEPVGRTGTRRHVMRLRIPQP